MANDSLLAAIRRDGRLEFWGNTEPKCPHCGTDFEVCGGDTPQLYDEGKHTITCDSCGNDFVCNTRLTYAFDTEDQPGAEDVPETGE